MAASSQTKTCSNSDCPCDNPQPVEQFAWCNRAKTKREAQCKVCRSAYQKQWRADNRESLLAKKKQYNADNREARLAYQQQHYQENREALQAYQRTPEARARRNARTRTQRATNQGKLLKAARELHWRFYKGIRCGDVTKQRGQALVGCTRQQYRDLLASKFKPGMSHDNHGRGTGTWQPDHVIPIAAFFGEINQANLEIVYWWKNVQPLWHAENAAKGNKYTAEGKRDLIVNYNAWVAAGKPPPTI